MIVINPKKIQIKVAKETNEAALLLTNHHKPQVEY